MRQTLSPCIVLGLFREKGRRGLDTLTLGADQERSCQKHTGTFHTFSGSQQPLLWMTVGSYGGCTEWLNVVLDGFIRLYDHYWESNGLDFRPTSSRILPQSVCSNLSQCQTANSMSGYIRESYCGLRDLKYPPAHHQR